MKKFYFTFLFFLIGVAAYSQSEIKNQPKLAETDKKPYDDSISNGTFQLQESGPISTSQKKVSKKTTSPNNEVEQKPTLTESTSPKRED